MKIELPERAGFIIDRLIEAGFDAYAVGGCVRDSILGRRPDDWDITTSAKPEQVKELFPRTIDTGIQHGTVTVMFGKEGYEVTTYRIDGEYEDARHPKNVTFTGELTEDLKRRDFTINAMAYNERAGLVDCFCGMEDLKAGIIRCVGVPEERFGEDALRMLRAVRFAAQLGFSIEKNTLCAIKKLAPSLEKISAERIQTELVKLLVSAHPEFIRTVYETGMTAVFLPEFDRMMETKQHHPHHCYTVGEHTIHVLTEIRADKKLRLAALLHDVAKPDCMTVGEDGLNHFYGHPGQGSLMAKTILRRLKFDNDTIAGVCGLIRFHDDNPEADLRSVRRAMNRTGLELYPALFELKRADAKAQSPEFLSEKLWYISQYESLYEQVLKEGQCVSMKDLAVNGRDLIDLGMKPGKELGEALKELLELVIEEPEKNTKEYLTGYILKSRFIG